MQRSNVMVQVLILAVLSLGIGSAWLHPVHAQGPPKSKPRIDRPGDAPYTPTKLEWAALELQSGYGNASWSNDNPVTISFIPLGDGKTVLCLFQYTPDVTAEAIKTTRDAEQVIFDKYISGRGWSWLRLQFQERTLPRPTR